MKKQKNEKKLSLNKETIANLNCIIGGEQPDGILTLFGDTCRKGATCKSPCATQQGYESCEPTCVDHTLCPGETCMC